MYRSKTTTATNVKFLRSKCMILFEHYNKTAEVWIVSEPLQYCELVASLGSRGKVLLNILLIVQSIDFYRLFENLKQISNLLISK